MAADHPSFSSTPPTPPLKPLLNTRISASFGIDPRRWGGVGNDQMSYREVKYDISVTDDTSVCPFNLMA